MKVHINRAMLLVCVCALGLAFAASSAAAQTTSERGYDESGVLGQVGGPGSDNNAPATVSAGNSDTGGSLPFTGLDLAIVVALGGTLVLTGVALRRSARPGPAG